MRTRAPAIEFADPVEPYKPRNTGFESDVAQLRREFDLTQEAAAEAFGCSRSLVALVETGERSLPFTLDEARGRLTEYTKHRDRDLAIMEKILNDSR